MLYHYNRDGEVWWLDVSHIKSRKDLPIRVVEKDGTLLDVVYADEYSPYEDPSELPQWVHDTIKIYQHHVSTLAAWYIEASNNIPINKKDVIYRHQFENIVASLSLPYNKK